MRLTTIAAAFAVAPLLATAGCSIFPPLEAPTPRRVEVDWAASLYQLDAFAYHPTEAGSPAFVGPTEGAPSGLVVVPSKDRRVRGFDAATGEERWAFRTKGPNVARPAAVGADVIVGSMDGHVYRVRQADGERIWRSDYPAKGGVVSPPVVAAGRVFVTSIDNRITALSASDGAPLWDKARPHASEFTITGQAGAALIGEDRVVTGFSDGQLVAFAVEDGATLWSVDLGGGATEFVDVDSTPVVVGDVVVASSYRRGLFGVDAATGDVRWLVRGEGYGTAAALEGELYVPQANGRIVAITAATGEVRWVARFHTERASTPAVSGKYVLAPTGDALALLDRVTGRLLARFDDSRGFSSTPEVAHGTVYAIGNSGTVYALGLY